MPVKEASSLAETGKFLISSALYCECNAGYMLLCYFYNAICVLNSRLTSARTTLDRAAIP